MNDPSDKEKTKNANPIETFEAFWKVFNERYAFFDVRGVDWQRQKEIYRPQVTDNTTPGMPGWRRRGAAGGFGKIC